MSTTNEQKTETTCNPCDSVVTIHVNKDAICGDGGKPNVDKKTISYNDKGELQWGGDFGDYPNKKFLVEVKKETDLGVRITTYEEVVEESSYHNNIDIDEIDAKMKYKKIITSPTVSEYVDSFSESQKIRYTKADVKGWYIYSYNESVSKDDVGRIDKNEYMSYLDYRYSVSGANNNYQLSLDNESGGLLEFSTKESSVIIATPVYGNARLQVDNKNVVRSINGILANEAGEIVFEEFPNGVVMLSPDKSKFRVTVGNDGTLSAIKVN
ncbi:hypothetical protein [Myroides profundi]|uniref:Uncharacterized protein n=1 Tax=Myroides profundi TaxID=480520 RepID=A0AAJ4W3G4_MYRPR|nr:hypothetical protein [Myroides profundi]AJH16669.1 hypothetical protein MPR_3557 [Myroides profundi]SEQ78151.1 hypothetical protein SAMN04488089_10623 [Myroides profundi]